MERKVEAFGAAGLILLAGAAWWVSRDYPVGTATAMGPGYVPRLLIIVLGLLGAALLVKAFTAKHQAVPFKLRPFLAVLGSIGLFAALIRTAGLFPATISLAVAASLAETPIRPRSMLFLSLALCALAYAIFVFALGMPLRLFWF